MSCARDTPAFSCHLELSKAAFCLLASVMSALVLIRHGAAIDKDVDATQPLSQEGQAQAEFVGNALAAYLELPSEFLPTLAQGTPCAVTVWHSDKERARGTASTVTQILTAAGCNVTQSTATGDVLSPNADPVEAKALIASSTSPLIVCVGHLPHLQRLALTLGVEATVDAFTPAGGVLLHDRGGKWSIAHMIGHGLNWWVRGASIYEPDTSDVEDVS